MNDFNSILESAKKDAEQITAFSGGTPPKPKAVGPTYLEKGDIFRFKDVHLNGNLFKDKELSKPYIHPITGETKTPEILFTVVELLDDNFNPIGAKRLYLGSLCKTVWGYSEDSNGLPKKNGKYIVSDGEVCKAIQKADDIISGINQFSMPLVVSDIHTIETKNFNAKSGDSKFRTASTFQIDKFVKQS